jgi:hypothetical protein
MAGKSNGAKVAAAMKRLRRFTVADLAETLDTHPEGARNWVASFHNHGLLKPNGHGERRGAHGIRPLAWEWQG